MGVHIVSGEYIKMGERKKKTVATATKSSDIIDVNDLSEDGRLIVEAIVVHLDIMKESFSKQLAEKIKEVDGLNLEVNSLKVKVAKLEEKIDDGDAYERRDTIVFSGGAVPQVSDGENCSTTVKNIVKEQLKINLALSDISTAHRIGKKTETQQPDRRNIIVKMCRRDLKNDILHQCREQKPDLFVNEHLTPSRNTIFYVLRKMKKDFPNKIAGCNTIDGKVFAWIKSKNKDERNTRVLVNTHLKLEDISRKVLGKELTTFIETWPH